MSIGTKISINQINCKFPVIKILKFNSPLFLHLFGKALLYYFFCQLGPKSCKKSTLLIGNRIPARSSEIPARRHYVCDWSGRTCNAHQLSSFSTASAYEMIFQIFTFIYNTVLRTRKKIKYKMNLKYKKKLIKIRSH